jgi:hypothetical protein
VTEEDWKFVLLAQPALALMYVLIAYLWSVFS